MGNILFENIIIQEIQFSSADSVKSKRGSGGTLKSRAWLCEDPHGSVVGDENPRSSNLTRVLKQLRYETTLQFSVLKVLNARRISREHEHIVTT